MDLKVVINGQVYVAEDCGGAIKHNCIDIYVATHQEGEDKGVYYTDVYLLRVENSERILTELSSKADYEYPFDLKIKIRQEPGNDLLYL